MHFWRGFVIHAAVSIAVPLALVLASLIPAFAVAFDYSIAPKLVYAFPVQLFAPAGGAPILWVSLLVAGLCCAAFAQFTRHRDAGDQWILAITAFAAWWIVWRLVGLAAGVHPHLNVRM